MLTAELRAALAEHKAALLALLDAARVEHKPALPDVPGAPDPERLHIPLSLDEAPSEWLARRGLRIAGGDPATGTLFVVACE